MWRQSANHSLSLRWAWKTAPWEFQTKLLHYFFTSNNTSNLHFTSISEFYVNTERDVVTVLLTFSKYLSLYLHIFTCTYRGTHTQAHMYNQHTRGIEKTRHKSLVERGGRKNLLETLHTHTQYIYVYIYIYIYTYMFSETKTDICIFFRNKNRYSRI